MWLMLYQEAKLKAARMSLYVRRGGPNYQKGLEKMRILAEEIGLPIEVYIHCWYNVVETCKVFRGKRPYWLICLGCRFMDPRQPWLESANRLLNASVQLLEDAIILITNSFICLFIFSLTKLSNHFGLHFFTVFVNGSQKLVRMPLSSNVVS